MPGLRADGIILPAHHQRRAGALEAYLDEAGPFEEIYQMLFAHGVESVGLAPIDRWRALLSRATRRGSFLGVEEAAFPKDFSMYVRYHRELRQIPARHPLPPPLTLEELDEFLDEHRGKYPVSWTEPRLHSNTRHKAV